MIAPMNREADWDLSRFSNFNKRSCFDKGTLVLMDPMSSSSLSLQKFDDFFVPLIALNPEDALHVSAGSPFEHSIAVGVVSRFFGLDHDVVGESDGDAVDGAGTLAARHMWRGVPGQPVEGEVWLRGFRRRTLPWSSSKSV